jgi:hypothetical protein
MADLAGISVPGLSDLKRRLRKLEADVRFLRSSRDLIGRASVDAGKNLIIRGALRVVGALDLTGTMSMKSAAGDELVRMGDMPFGRGFELKRDNGIQAYVLAKPFTEDDQQTFHLIDQFGADLFSESPLTGGIYRPHLEHPFEPISATSGTAVLCGPYGFERTTSSATFETLFMHDGKRQNGFIDLKIAAKCSDGTTAGVVQLVDLATGLPLPGFFLPSWLAVIPAGTTSMTVFDPSPDQALIAGFAVGAPMRLGLQARRTAGAGSITVSIAQSIGG